MTFEEAVQAAKLKTRVRPYFGPWATALCTAIGAHQSSQIRVRNEVTGESQMFLVQDVGLVTDDTP